MAEAALLIYAGYLGLAFGVRSYIQWRRTGTTGFKGVSGRVGSSEWLAGALFAAALILGVLAPVLALTGTVGSIAALDHEGVNAIGVLLTLAGIGLTLIAQLAMGTSWRIGVDENETTDLVTHGPFAIVRNPIFTAMIPTAIGLGLMVPSWIAIAALVALVIALELQVRVVEEPYLRRVQGDRYAAYTARVGRFLPRIGRIERRRRRRQERG